MNQLPEPWRPHLQAIAAVANQCLKVRWDRCFEAGGGVLRLYGWVDRPDGRSDFVLLDVQRYSDVPTIDFSFGTSSADPALNAELAAAIGIDVDDHAACQRIEQVFGGTITHAIKLSP